MRCQASAFLLLAALAGCSQTAPPEEPIRAVRTRVVEAGNTAAHHDYAADIRPQVESRLGFRVGGKLIRRMVNVGDAVRPGQVLAQLDAQDLQLGHDAAQAALAAAKASLEINEAEFKRFRDLRDQGFISNMELDRREATLKAARAQADQARAQAGVQSNQSRYTTLLADAAGVVTAVDAEAGAVVNAGTTVLRVALDRHRDAVFSVPEGRVDAMRALLGKRDAVTVVWDGTDARAVAATVREVGAAADPVTRTVLVKADLGAVPMRLGQTVTVRVNSPAVEGVIKLPLQAVFEGHGKSLVWLLDRTTMTVQARAIGIAGADGNAVVVASGLTPGQAVVTAGVHALTEGQKVRLYVEPSAAIVNGATSVPNPSLRPLAASGFTSLAR